MACSSPKKPPVQSTLRGFFSGNSNSTPDPDEDEVVAVGKMVKTPPSSRRPKKRRRSTPTLAEDLDEPRGETLNNNDTPRRKSLRTKNEKIRPQRSASSSAELDSDFESEAADLKKSKGKRKNGKTEKKLKRSTKLPSPKLTPETDKKKFKGKFSTPPPGNVRSIMSYFAKSTTPVVAAVDSIICIGEVSPTVVDVDVDVVIMRTPVKSCARSLEILDPELLHISPAKSELSVSSFEFEKEERRPSILISDSDSDSEVEVETSSKTSNAVVEDDVVSSEENEDEENADAEITVIRSDRKRIKFNSPGQSKSSKKRGSVKATKAKKRPKSVLENVESQDSGLTQSESLSGSSTSTPSSSQPQVEGGRRRSSRIQQIQIEKMEQASKIEIEPSSPEPAPTSKKSRRRKKSRISSSEDSVTIEHEDAVVRLSSSSSSTEFSSDEDDEDFVRSKKKKKGTLKMASIFLSKKEREKEMQRLKEEKEPKKIISQATLDFLRSGVPEEIVKAQKSIVKKKTELDLFEPMQPFPTFTHNIELGEAVTVDFTQSVFPIKNIPNEDSDAILLSKLQSYLGKMQKLDSDFHSKQFCCGEAGELPEDFLAIMEKIPRSSSESDSLPWVDKYRVQRRKDLVIDKKAHQKFETWLKQWRSDIKDDGGVSRKVVEKRKKKRESDSDFVTDEEAEEDYMKKSVVLVGPTGCGKTAMVYVLTKQIGFKIVEVSFSSRRSGKDVIQSVEEATLSRRISDNAEVDDDHCLLLFKDIDQLHPEEDEGFHAAVAQLITASCRPIVMTTSQPDFSVIDPKIHKKDPLWIYFNPPTPTAIVQNVLLPVIESELERQKRSYDLDSNENDKRILTTVLESLVRHSKCDIRRSLNQAQILWSTRNFFSLKTVHWNMCPLLDLEFTASGSSSQKQLEIELDLPVKQTKTKAERRLDIQAMEDLAKNFQLLTDVDIVSSSLKSCVSDTDHCSPSQTILPYFETGFQSALSEMRSRNEPLFHVCRSLILETGQHKAKKARITELYDELSSYVDQYENYDAIAYVRTIVKGSVVRSVGSDMKRNGRIKPYFNRLGRDAIDRMCNNFGFPEELAELKLAFGSETRVGGRNPH